MQHVFINLPVKSSKKSQEFYEAIGLVNNPNFSSEDTVCMVMSEHIYFMLLETKRFAEFSPRPLADTSKTVGALVALNRDSREAVDDFVARAIAAGGMDNNKDQDLGFMYGKSVSDPDGHILEPFYMDMSAFSQEQ